MIINPLAHQEMSILGSRYKKHGLDLIFFYFGILVTPYLYITVDFGVEEDKHDKGQDAQNDESQDVVVV